MENLYDKFKEYLEDEWIDDIADVIIDDQEQIDWRKDAS